MTQAHNPLFDSIRPYLDSEVPAALRSLAQDPEFAPILTALTREMPSGSDPNALLSSIDSVRAFKSHVVLLVMHKLTERTTFSLTSSGKSGLDKSIKHLFISNHRDIILDSAFLNVITYETMGMLPRIAIGDNLLIRPWIRTLVRLCDAFIVKRAPSVREMLQESHTLSSYIRHTITSGEENVWIAQREGRAKDSDDRTQPALLKMLAMSAPKGDASEALSALNIVPLAISYEYDPCDYLKAKEMLQKRLNPEHKKSQADDYQNMQEGLTGYKGRVHFAFAPQLGDLSPILRDCPGKQEQWERIAAVIDESIHRHYRFYPGNYVAYDMLHGVKRFSEMYSAGEKSKFSDYLQSRLDLIEMEGKDEAFLREQILKMYANPLINNLATK